MAHPKLCAMLSCGTETGQVQPGVYRTGVSLIWERDPPQLPECFRERRFTGVRVLGLYFSSNPNLRSRH